MFMSRVCELQSLSLELLHARGRGVYRNVGSSALGTQLGKSVSLSPAGTFCSSSGTGTGMPHIPFPVTSPCPSSPCPFLSLSMVECGSASLGLSAVTTSHAEDGISQHSELWLTVCLPPLPLLIYKDISGGPKNIVSPRLM